MRERVGPYIIYNNDVIQFSDVYKDGAYPSKCEKNVWCNAVSTLLSTIEYTRNMKKRYIYVIRIYDWLALNWECVCSLPNLHAVVREKLLDIKRDCEELYTRYAFMCDDNEFPPTVNYNPDSRSSTDASVVSLG